VNIVGRVFIALLAPVLAAAVCDYLETGRARSPILVVK